MIINGSYAAGPKQVSELKLTIITKSEAKKWEEVAKVAARDTLFIFGRVLTYI